MPYLLVRPFVCHGREVTNRSVRPKPPIINPVMCCAFGSCDCRCAVPIVWKVFVFSTCDVCVLYSVLYLLCHAQYCGFVRDASSVRRLCVFGMSLYYFPDTLHHSLSPIVSPPCAASVSLTLTRHLPPPPPSPRQQYRCFLEPCDLLSPDADSQREHCFSADFCYSPRPPRAETSHPSTPFTPPSASAAAPGRPPARLSFSYRVPEQGVSFGAGAVPSLGLGVEAGKRHGLDRRRLGLDRQRLGLDRQRLMLDR